MSRGKLRARFTDEEVKYARNKATRDNGTIDYKKMSAQLSNNPHGTFVSPELCVYWAKQFDTTKKNGEDYRTLAIPNRELRNSRKLRKPSPLDDKATVPAGNSHDSILVIPDLHAPYQHPDTLEFLATVAAHYKPDTIVNLGDETDMHGLSFHDSDPNLDSAGVELSKAREFLQKLERMFPQMLLCHSNHGSMLHRKAKVHGIPVEMIKSYREVLFPNGNGQGWDWAFEHILDLPNGEKVMFKHQASGDLLAAAAHERCNLVIGHLHGKFAINYAASKQALYWGLNGGCLIDAKSMAFSYGENFKNKPIIGCSVIVDSLPILVPMRLDAAGRWIGKL
ncbi:phosphatase 2a-like protein (endogenous virus) [Gutovirus Vc1]|uniref:Phosphatase 2a-like protein n=1 Tax=Vibrio phage Vc1 TaxID=1480731 RepID=X2KT53_9CAUD|nr:phosphatase 2a-like protein [Vibrio phage Vc1]AHN84693.1 phosphatase 2a-like protein [Vibrio phage Vc1]